MTSSIILDVHGLVTIRIDDAPPAIAHRIKTEYATFVTGDQATIDVEIEFRSGVKPATEHLRAGHSGSAASPATETAWLASPGGYTQIQGAKTVERLVADSEVSPISWVEIVLRGAVIRPILARKGFAFLHASAFSVTGANMALSAWGGTGKTKLVLEALRRGGSYFGDDLCILSAGGELYSFPERITVYPYNLEHISDTEVTRPPRKSQVFAAAHRAASSAVEATRPIHKGTLWGRLAERAAGAMSPMAAFPVAIDQLFTEAQIGRVNELTHLVVARRVSGMQPSFSRTNDLASILEQLLINIRYEHRRTDEPLMQLQFICPHLYQRWFGDVDVQNRNILAEAISKVDSVLEVDLPQDIEAGEVLDRILEL